MTALQEKIMAFLNENDVFCRENGIRLVAISDDASEAQAEIGPGLMNASNVVQGGAIFALCDLAFAGIANSGGERTVAQTASISYLRPGTGKRLRAAGRLIRRGRRTAVVAVEVTNDAGKLVAVATVTGCPLGIPILPEQQK